MAATAPQVVTARSLSRTDRHDLAPVKRHRVFVTCRGEVCDPADGEMMVAMHSIRFEVTVDHHDRSREPRTSVVRRGPIDTCEPVVGFLRESPAQVTLARGEHVHRESPRCRDGRPRSRRDTRKKTDERWVERHRHERTDRDALRRTIRIDPRHDDDARRYQTENLPETLRVEIHHAKKLDQNGLTIPMGQTRTV